MIATTIEVGRRLHEMSRLLRLDTDATTSLTDDDIENMALAYHFIANAWHEPGDFRVRLADAAAAVARRVETETILSADSLSELTLLLFAIDEVQVSRGRTPEDINDPSEAEIWWKSAELHVSLAARHGDSMVDPWGRVSSTSHGSWLEIDYWAVPVDLWFLSWAYLNDPQVIARLVAARCSVCHRTPPAGAA